VHGLHMLLHPTTPLSHQPSLMWLHTRAFNPYTLLSNTPRNNVSAHNYYQAKRVTLKVWDLEFAATKKKKEKKLHPYSITSRWPIAKWFALMLLDILEVFPH
jgi:hypothetical protein